jgi:hypothetical protein
MDNFVINPRDSTGRESCVVREILPAESIGIRKTLQIALYHAGLDGIKAGLRMFPSSKVILLYKPDQEKISAEDQIREYAERLVDVLGVQVELKQVKSPLLEDVLDVIKEIYFSNRLLYDDVLLNLTEGDKILTCSALSSAFIFGMRAFWTDGQRPYIFPVIRLGYHRTLSDAKLSIILAVQKYGGSVTSLEDLVNSTGYDKAQLSRHINGAPDSKGLVELGLVEVERLDRGRLSIRLTALGKILLTGLET